MINLFEYQNKVPYEKELEGFEIFLDEIWQNREKTSSYYDNDQNKVETQRFLQFFYKTEEIKSNKYVGVISYNGKKINLLPKIFYNSNKEYDQQEINQIQKHILWWLSYCRKIKFPNYQTSFGSLKNDFFEVLIYLFSKYTRELLSNSIYQQFQEVNKTLLFLKGRLDINAYINENFRSGKWHKLNCIYDSFEFDNEFNRIIKYVTTLLFNATLDLDNKKNLREILFILDEVKDVRVTSEQCSKIKFNQMFSDFIVVKDYCQLFLSNHISFDYKDDMRLFAFLIPMEYLFEDFVFGFIEKEVEEVNAKSQRKDVYLDEDRNFNLKPDLFIKVKDKSLIADTKYKIIYSNDNDPKNGISQNDLYQMIAYAIRFEIDEIILFYPSTIDMRRKNATEIKIKDALASNHEITIKAYQLPIIDNEIIYSSSNDGLELDELFNKQRIKLKESIIDILLENENSIS